MSVTSEIAASTLGFTKQSQYMKQVHAKRDTNYQTFNSHLKVLR